MAIPADIPAEVAQKMRNYAEKAYQAMNGAGLSRCDFSMMNKEISISMKLMPLGFTQWSMYPLLWENMGLSYSELIEELVSLAQEAFEIRESHLL